MAAAYQTFTLKVPCRDLCVAAGAMLVSAGLAAVAHFMHPMGFALLTTAV
jgi:hypothetical protein